MIATEPAARNGSSGCMLSASGDALDETEDEQSSDNGQEVLVVESVDNAIHCHVPF